VYITTTVPALPVPAVQLTVSPDVLLAGCVTVNPVGALGAVAVVRNCPTDEYPYDATVPFFAYPR
jgi:hypothetical protein